MRLRAALLAALLGTATAPARASSHGSVEITVVDVAGTPLEGVRVRVTNKDTWVTIERETDAEGRVFIHKVAAGEFRLRIDRPGYQLRADARHCLAAVGDRLLRHRATLQKSGDKARPPEDPCPRLAPTSQESTFLDPLPGDDVPSASHANTAAP